MAGGQAQHRDRARLISKVASTTRTEGGYTKTEQAGPWFRCTYDPGAAPETRSAGGVRRRRTATVTCGRRALDGSAIDPQPSDIVEVDSTRYGSFRVDITDITKEIPRRILTGFSIAVGATDRTAPG